MVFRHFVFKNARKGRRLRGTSPGFRRRRRLKNSEEKILYLGSIKFIQLNFGHCNRVLTNPKAVKFYRLTILLMVDNHRELLKNAEKGRFSVLLGAKTFFRSLMKNPSIFYLFI